MKRNHFSATAAKITTLGSSGITNSSVPAFTGISSKLLLRLKNSLLWAESLCLSPAVHGLGLGGEVYAQLDYLLAGCEERLVVALLLDLFQRNIC